MAEDTQTTQTTDTQVQAETKPVEPAKVEFYRTFTTQEDFDNETAKIRGTAERKAKNELLKQLGIDSEDKLEALKTAYENSKTEQERIADQLKQLDTLKAELAENKAIITALSKTSNKPADEITKLVKMAKGLVSDDCTIEQALDEVLTLVNKKEEKPPIPTSQVVTTIPDNNIPVEENPFKTGNIDGMMKLIKENPEKARQLAKLANYPINF